MAEVDWIRLNTDIRSNRKIKRIRKMEGGNDMFLLWILILTIAGECNDRGRLSFTDSIPYDSELIADETGFSIYLVEKALQIFLSFSMLYIENDFYIIEGWEEYQNADGLEKIREQNRSRQKRWYESHKDNPNVRKDSDLTLDLTLPNATDKNRKELDKNKNKRENNLSFLDI